MPFETSRLQAAILKVLRDRYENLEPFFKYWLAARLECGTPAFREILATYRLPALLRYASAVGAHEAVYDHPLLSGFRATVEQVGRAFAELIAGNQTDRVPAGPGRRALQPPAPEVACRRITVEGAALRSGLCQPGESAARRGRVATAAGVEGPANRGLRREGVAPG